MTKKMRARVGDDDDRGSKELEGKDRNNNRHPFVYICGPYNSPTPTQGRIQAFFIREAHGGPTVTLGWPATAFLPRRKAARRKFFGGFKPHSTPEKAEMLVNYILEQLYIAYNPV